ncbi:MAG: hypothetical protein FWC43_01975 [Planctomycetaceae bacterium]|nr:hypothetical protein [Planctomycetaceae bacterium]
MKPEKVLKFKGIGNRESEIGNRKLEEVFHSSLITYHLSLITDARCPMPLTVLSYHLFTV